MNKRQSGTDFLLKQCHLLLPAMALGMAYTVEMYFGTTPETLQEYSCLFTQKEQ